MKPWKKRHRLLARWTTVSVVAIAGVLTYAMLTQDSGEKAVLPGEMVQGLTDILTREAPTDAVPFRFENVTTDVGVSFRHFPFVRSSLLPEDMGSGVAVGDYDGDGWPDLFFVNISGSAVPGSPLKASARLYRNVEGASFEDVTEAVGVAFVGIGMGAAWGDFDNDGDLDLYVTADGDNALYENLGDGTFEDVTSRAGAQDTRFSTGCSWGDYDRDGDLDLYVSNYVEFIFRETDRSRTERQYATEQPYTLNPSAYAPQPNALFRNNGDGTFTDVAEEAGVADSTGRSLSAAWVDMNNDGWPDLYVANDISNNGVFLSHRDGTFEDIGPGSLAADYRGAMGIAVADFDDDLDQDIMITHWIAQENALYKNMFLDDLMGPSKGGKVWFMDDAEQFGLGQSALDCVGWANGFCDFDNDGRRDLWLVNGNTLEVPEDHRRLVPQAPFVFWGRGEEGFVDVAARVCDDFARPFVGRGGAHVDFDRDGLVDLVLLVHGGDAMVLRNVTKEPGRSLRITLRQTGGNTAAIGARAYVTVGGRTQMATVGAGPSYLSQHELTLHFGLGSVKTADSVRIVWADGCEETHHPSGDERELVFSHEAAYPVRRSEQDGSG